MDSHPQRVGRPSPTALPAIPEARFMMRPGTPATGSARWVMATAGSAEESGEGASQAWVQQVDESIPVIVPNRWQGEADCLVGPFSGREVAAYFANRLVDFGHFEVFSMRVFPRRNAWYVEVRARAAARHINPGVA